MGRDELLTKVEDLKYNFNPKELLDYEYAISLFHECWEDPTFMTMIQELYSLFNFLIKQYEIERLFDIAGLDFSNYEDLNVYRFLFTKLEDELKQGHVHQATINSIEEVLFAIIRHEDTEPTTTEQKEDCVADCELCQKCIADTTPNAADDHIRDLKLLDIESLPEEQAHIWLNELKFVFDINNPEFYLLALRLFLRIYELDPNEKPIQVFVHHIIIAYQLKTAVENHDEVHDFVVLFYNIWNDGFPKYLDEIKRMLNIEQSPPIPIPVIEQPKFDTKILVNKSLNKDYLPFYIQSKKQKEYKCEICGLNTWQNEPLQLILDYKDGNINNQELTNLRFLCPNCFSQVGHE